MNIQTSRVDLLIFSRKGDALYHQGMRAWSNIITNVFIFLA